MQVSKLASSSRIGCLSFWRYVTLIGLRARVNYVFVTACWSHKTENWDLRNLKAKISCRCKAVGAVFVSFQRALSSSPYLAWKIGVQISDMQNCKVYRETKQSVLGLAIKTLLTPYGYEYVPDGTTHPVRLPMPFHANFLIPDLLLNSLSNQSLATFTS